MISVFWLFTGVLAGLLVTSVFNPAERTIPSLPTPADNTVHQTKSGCVKFKTEEVPCDGHETSLNVIASQHK